MTCANQYFSHRNGGLLETCFDCVGVLDGRWMLWKNKNKKPRILLRGMGSGWGWEGGRGWKLTMGYFKQYLHSPCPPNNAARTFLHLFSRSPKPLIHLFWKRCIHIYRSSSTRLLKVLITSYKPLLEEVHTHIFRSSPTPLLEVIRSSFWLRCIHIFRSSSRGLHELLKTSSEGLFNISIKGQKSKQLNIMKTSF